MLALIDTAAEEVGLGYIHTAPRVPKWGDKHLIQAENQYLSLRWSHRLRRPQLSVVFV